MPKFFSRDNRKYPIQKDESGRSIRQRCFEAFDKGKRPSKVCKELGVSFKTTCTYFYQWKKLPRDFQFRYEMEKDRLKNYPEWRQAVVEQLSESLGQSQREIEAHLQTPWGLKQLMSGQYQKILREEKEKRSRQGRRILNNLIDALIENSGVTQKEIIGKLYELLEERSS